MATPPINDDQALGFDPGLAVEHLRAADPVLGRIIDEIGPFRMRLRPAPSVFAALAEAIVYQQKLDINKLESNEYSFKQPDFRELIVNRLLAQEQHLELAWEIQRSF